MSDLLPEHKYEVWTVEDAQKALDTQVKNRDLSRHRVEQYARDMAEGRWNAVTTVMFNKKGEMIDGQHRATAQIKADVTLPWLVVRGAPDEWQNDIDNTFVRNIAQQLKMDEGIDQPRAALLAAVARQCYRVENDKMAGGSAISSSELTQTIRKHPELRHSTEVAWESKSRTMTPIPPNVIGIAHWMIAQENGTEVADWFMNKVITMDGESSKTMIGVLNKRCNELKRQRVRVPHRDFLSMLIKTWNLVSEGKMIGRVYTKSKAKSYVLPRVKKIKVGVYKNAA